MRSKTTEFVENDFGPDSVFYACVFIFNIRLKHLFIYILGSAVCKIIMSYANYLFFLPHPIAIDHDRVVIITNIGANELRLRWG